MTKTIIFDIGGVVTHTDFKAIYSNFARRIGISPEFVIEYHKIHLADLLLGNITAEKFWQDMRDAGGDPKLNFEKIWVEEGVHNREINQGLLDIIADLRRHYSVGALTNLTASRLLIDKEMDLYSHFDYSVLSCMEHLKKPDAEFYRRRTFPRGRETVRSNLSLMNTNQEPVAAAEQSWYSKGFLYQYPDNDALRAQLEKMEITIQR